MSLKYMRQHKLEVCILGETVGMLLLGLESNIVCTLLGYVGVMC